MKIKLHEIEITPDNPFENCKLDREKYALILTDVLNAYADGFVLAINNDWGTGKTTFVRMWQQHLKNNGFQTIYFNAWENDFDNNPMVAIMSELKTLTNDANTEVFKSIVSKGAVIIKNVLPALLKALVKSYIDADSVLNAIENAAKGTTEIFEEEIKEHATKKKTIKEFRDELETFIKTTNKGKPLVFIVDELDRCRPNYAVESLEQMKHLFSVPGIVFVLAIDKNHLASSVRGFYGSESINTDEYLRRFIDLEYSVPNPSIKTWCKYLFDYYSFDEFYKSPDRNSLDESGDFLKISELLFTESNATLRQQEKIFGQTRLILCTFQPNQSAFSNILLLLVFLKTMNKKLYQDIESNSISLQELSDAFSSLITSSYLNPYGINLNFVLAELIHLYNNSKDFHNRAALLENDEKGELKSIIHSKFDNEKNKGIASCFKAINNNMKYYDKGLRPLLNKINLTDPLIFNKEK